MSEKPLTLGQKQRIFTRNIGLLIGWAYREGFELTFGEALRTAEQAALYAKQGKGSARSVHLVRLAVDFNLFIDGVYQTRSEAYAPLGAFWKKLHPLNRWGGDFKMRDGNHFSMTHDGVA